MGFTELHKSPYGLVRFYRTVSPVHRSSSPGRRALKARLPAEAVSLGSRGFSLRFPTEAVSLGRRGFQPRFPTEAVSLGKRGFQPRFPSEAVSLGRRGLSPRFPMESVFFGRRGLSPRFPTEAVSLGRRGFQPRLPIESERCSLLSVALSIASPLLGVTQHPALRSPDFPHPITMDLGRDHLLNSSLTIGYHKWRIQRNPYYEHPLVEPQLVQR